MLQTPRYPQQSHAQDFAVSPYHTHRHPKVNPWTPRKTFDIMWKMAVYAKEDAMSIAILMEGGES